MVGVVTFCVETLAYRATAGADMILCFDIEEFLDRDTSAGVLETSCNDPSGARSLGCGFFKEFDLPRAP